MTTATEPEANETDSLPPRLRGRSIAGQVLTLGGPVLVEQAMLYLVGFSDTVLTGRYLQVEHLAAVTVSSYLLWFVGSLLMVASAGGTALVARSIGAGDHPAASRLAQQAMLLGLVAGSVLLVVGQLAAGPLVRFLNLEGPTADAAAQFLRIVLLAGPALAALSVGNACLRGAGDTRTGMLVMVLVNLINVALSWALVRGFGPFPSLGLAGVAIGTAVGEGTGGLIVLGLLLRGRSGLKLDVRGFRPHPPDLRRLLRISLPAAGESATNSACQLWFLGLINRLGETATAAHGVAIRCEALAFLTIAAFAIPASTLTGQYLGARRPDLAARAARTACALGVGALAAIGVVLYFQAGPLVGLFLGRNQPDVAAQGVPVLRLVAFALPPFAVLTVLTSALRGAGDTRWPLAIVLFGYLVVRIPLTYRLTTPSDLGGIGWGLYGAWVAMAADILVRSSLIAARFASGRWARIRV